MSLVAETGFEPRDLQVMGLTSYQAALLRDVIYIIKILFLFFKHELPFVRDFLSKTNEVINIDTSIIDCDIAFISTKYLVLI